MESQPQNPEFRIYPESFHPCFSLSSFTIHFLNPVAQALFEFYLSECNRV